MRYVFHLIFSICILESSERLIYLYKIRINFLIENGQCVVASSLDVNHVGGTRSPWARRVRPSFRAGRAPALFGVACASPVAVEQRAETRLSVLIMLDGKHLADVCQAGIGGCVCVCVLHVTK